MSRRGVPARLAVATLAALVCAVAAHAAVAGIVDINPNQSTLDPSDPDGASGGRLNGLATVPGDNDVFYGASEWGGVFKSTDAGLTWTRLSGHVANAAWDVEVDPSASNRVYATSFFDGRAPSGGAPTTRAGINVSTDAGATWTRPASAIAPPNSATYTCATARRSEPSAFGIAIRPDAPANVFIGTNCGLAISTDSGATWTYVDPTPATQATNVWDVVAQSGGTIDVCGDDGHLRSTDNGATWTQSAGLPTGRCSIAVSPDESYVLFVAASDNNVWETDDADATNPTWTNLGTPDGRRQGRIPFAVTNQRADDGSDDVFDLWFSDVSLFRAGCTTPDTRPSPDTGGSLRCPVARTGAAASPPPAGWAGPFTRSTGAHDDAGDIVFDTEGGSDACPELYSSDGGVYYNTDNGSDCHNPNWEQPNVTPHALWVYAMDGADQPGDANEDLYFGNQDNGSFATANAAAGSPSWINRDCCDVFDIVADPTRVVYTLCCGFSLRFANPGNLTGVTNVATQPPGCCPTFNFPDFIDRFADNSYVAATNQGAFITTAFTASPTVWTQLGAASTPAGGFCAVQAAVSGGTPTFFGQTQCAAGEGGGSAQVWSYTGTAPGGTWQRIDNNDGLAGGFTVFAVDPANPNRLYAANNAAGGPQMVFSTDGGTTWDNDPELDTMMTGNGAFLYRTQRGPTSFTGFGGYSQPSLLAYDPEDSSIIVAGGRDSGVFLSTDAGANWSLLTDPFTPDTSGKEHLPRPMFAYFDHEPATTTSVYLGTQGRGVWRISFQIPTADAGGPYTTDEGVDVPLTATGNDPDGQPLTFEWDLDGDGAYDDATGANVTFEDVGQDGVFPVSVKVTDTDGAFDVADSTVTVANVAPTVTASSDGPKPEGTAVTVTGIVTDPGWLDPLSATIDWGDGTPVEALGGMLENVRPDATFAFNGSHVYGDNGTFTATVCGFDDDTSTCEDVSIEITNVDPTATIDESGTVVVNGIPTFIAHAGETIDFSGRSTDPGSDDLDLSWDWDDGPPAPDVTTTYLVNPPLPDPFPSPSVQPRDVTDVQSHAFGDACFYEVGFAALDDDGGAASDSVNVVVVGNGDKLRSAGWWKNQYRPKSNLDFTLATLQCYLEIAGYMSTVFDEVRDASTFAAAFDVLDGGDGSEAAKLERVLLEQWLNFANGVIGLDQPVNVTGGSLPDGTFWQVVAAAEAVRANPASTSGELRAERQKLQRITPADL